MPMYEPCAVARWILTEGAGKAWTAAVSQLSGDSAGGIMTAALTLIAKERVDVPLVHQGLFYLVADASLRHAPLMFNAQRGYRPSGHHAGDRRASRRARLRLTTSAQPRLSARLTGSRPAV